MDKDYSSNLQGPNFQRIFLPDLSLDFNLKEEPCDVPLDLEDVNRLELPSPEMRQTDASANQFGSPLLQKFVCASSSVPATVPPRASTNTVHKVTMFSYEKNVIESVQRYPILYAKNLKVTNRKAEKKVAWKRAAADCKISVEECRDIWGKLRDKFGKEVRARQRSELNVAGCDGGAAEVLKPPSDYFTAMQFLLGQMRIRKESILLSATPQTPPGQTFENSRQDDSRDTSSQSIPGDHSGEESILPEEGLTKHHAEVYEQAEGAAQAQVSVVPKSLNSSPPPTSRSPVPTKRKKYNNKQEDNNLLESLQGTIDETFNKLKSRLIYKEAPKVDYGNRDVAFCLYVATELSQMSPDKNKELRKIINDFIYDN